MLALHALSRIEIGLLCVLEPRVPRDVEGAHEEGREPASGAAATDGASGASVGLDGAGLHGAFRVPREEVTQGL